MTYSELTEIPTPTYLIPGNTIQFSIRSWDGDVEEFDGIGMITDIDFDYPGDDGNDELDWNHIRFCPTIRCGDGQIRYTSLFYTRVDHQTSSLAVLFDNELYEPDSDPDGGTTLFIHEIFDC